MPQAHVRETGRGPAVVCLHGNASSSTQWRQLMGRLAPRHRVLAPDHWGAGRSPEWPDDREITLADEVRLMQAMLDDIEGPMVLIGHSYGAALALKVALMYPGRVRALALYEPTLFSLIQSEGASPNDADGIRDAVHRAGQALDRGEPMEAAREFLDYWGGPGTWQRTPAERQPVVAAATANVRRWWHALSTEPATRSELRQLDMPVLCLMGGASPRSAHGVVDRLAELLPDLRLNTFDDLGHLGPLTDAERVNEALDGFVAGLG